MKRYIITFQLNDGVTIQRHDSFFGEPFMIHAPGHDKTTFQLLHLLSILTKRGQTVKDYRPAANTRRVVIDINRKTGHIEPCFPYGD